MDTRRVALKRDSFVSVASMEVARADVETFIATLADVGHDELQRTLDKTVQIKVQGPAWRPPMARDEVLSLPIEEAVFLTPVLKETTMTAPFTSWRSTDVKMVLLCQELNTLATVVVGDDREYLEILFTASKNICDDEIEFAGRVSAAVDALVLKTSPTAEDCFDALEERPIAAYALKPPSKTHLMPAWIACACLRWCEQHLRLHVVAAASADLDADGVGLSQELYVESARLSGIVFNGEVKKQLNCYVHTAMCRCVCKCHRRAATAAGSWPPAAVGAHAYAIVRMSFCGCKLDAFGRCGLHPTHSPPSFQVDDEVACEVCLKGLQCELVCFHKDASGQTKPTTVLKLPCEQEPFAVTLAAAAVELAEEDSPFEPSQLRDVVLNALGGALVADDELRSGVDMLERDQIAESVLRTREYWYGRKRANTPQAVYKRGGGGKAATWLQMVGQTHGHLLSQRERV